ncbi:phage tail protein [Neobacillus mesonae]|uniref:phage tail protein n=1 Tax=Neobacillus mesonae TaxID=1193713 RepID=UPI0020400792|nr:tail fiber protein [Neobacillus mesonae]MCM3570956.1 tail fiber protein [Neobacillus mesonae]
MSEPFIGEIRLFAFNFAPVGWAMCNGQLLPIAQNTALFALIGTTYGGDGRTTFALPDLRGRVAMHLNGGNPNLSPRQQGEFGGSETHTLSVNEMPTHSHVASASQTEANTIFPTNNIWAVTEQPAYSQSQNTTLASSAIQPAGGNQAHNNLQPYLVLNYCIALQGIFPSRV